MRLRGRFTVWFLFAALVPIGAAGLVTREVLSQSYRDDVERRRGLAEQIARREITRGEESIVATVRALADRDRPLVGGYLLELDKANGEMRLVYPLLKKSSAAEMEGNSLDALFLVDRELVVAAPHYIDARGSPDPRHAERAKKTDGVPFYSREPVVKGNKQEKILVVQSAKRARGADWITVVGARAIDSAWLAPVRSFPDIDARLVASDGTVLIKQEETDWGDEPPIEIDLKGPDGKPIASVEIAVLDTDLEQVLWKVTIAVLVLAGGAMLITTLLAFFVASRMTRNIDKLVDGAQAAARGDLDHRVDVRSRDEIGELARSFNAMMEDLRSSKERLVIAERIAAWQEIARRLAHEIKNPLTPIQMSMETLRKTYEKKHPSFDETFEESTATVLEETARLKRIVTEFSEFSRMPKPSVGPCDLNDIVSGALSLYEGSVNVTKQLADGMPVIEGDKDQLSQVLLNLLENARDAIAQRPDGGEGGRIEVRTLVVPGGVQLVVEDNGPGIKPEIKDKLFTPYFTTKHGSGGTGLGLAVTHRIVSDHGGRIRVGDASPTGARFVVELPS